MQEKIWMVRRFSFKFPLCLIYVDSVIWILREMHFLVFSDHAGEDENGEGADLQQQQRNPWDGTDRDYEYEEVQ